MVPEAISALANLIDAWNSNKKDGEHKIKQKIEAVQLVMNAVVATKAYLHDLQMGVVPSRDVEKDLSIKWVNASMAIVEYDHALHEVAKIKALGWADPNEWARATSRPWAIKLNTIVEHCEYILKSK
ncbi:hypothetical protein [Pseudomonas tohonis]|uniref:hypothetical protein n=1 Tax=Pseudomonas tohonis TaxID=2725477 RepID=UPI00255B4975|nr:hypothetical protein [Pseudomonas tohonis]